VLPYGGAAFAVPAGFQLRPSGLGQRLPEAVRQRMESVFGATFGDVRIHVGHEATTIGALAFTIGSDLYFAPGQYNPQTMQGQQLLGHELTHVVQQRAGRVRNPLGSGVAVVQDPALEAEAERMGMRAATSPALIQAKPAGIGPAGGSSRAMGLESIRNGPSGAILPSSPPAVSAARRRPAPIIPANGSLQTKGRIAAPPPADSPVLAGDSGSSIAIGANRPILPPRTPACVALQRKPGPILPGRRPATGGTDFGSIAPGNRVASRLAGPIGASGRKGGRRPSVVQRMEGAIAVERLSIVGLRPEATADGLRLTGTLSDEREIDCSVTLPVYYIDPSGRAGIAPTREADASFWTKLSYTKAIRVQNITAEPKQLKLGDALAYYVAVEAERRGATYVLAMHVVPRARNFYTRLGFEEYDANNTYEILTARYEDVTNRMREVAADAARAHELPPLGIEQANLNALRQEANMMVRTATLKETARANFYSGWTKTGEGAFEQKG
jgi:GNAT superfamily N-acetyltransferase